MNAMDMHSMVVRAAALAAPLLLAAGCASSDIRAQWTDPQFANRPLQGATVMVHCEAREMALRQVCLDEVSEQVRAAGAVPVPAPDSAAGEGDAQMLDAARSAGARAVLAARIAPGQTVATPRSRVGFGVGTWGGNVGTSVGVGVPVGSQRVDTSYTADMALTEVASGKLMWTSTLATPASRDFNAQVAQLAKSGVEAAKQAGLF